MVIKRDRNYMDDAISNGRRQRQLETLAALYVVLGNPARDGFVIMDYPAVADLANISRHQVADFVKGLDRADVIKSRMTRQPLTRPDGQNIEVTRTEVWLHLPHDQALERLHELYAQERRTGESLTMPVRSVKPVAERPAPVVRVIPSPIKEDDREARLARIAEVYPEAAEEARHAGEPVALAPERSSEVTRAIAGPEPTSPFAVLAPLRKDEYGALVEAARQYASRRESTNKMIAALREQGVTINEALLEKAIKFPVDDRMEALSEILPYINRLETLVENLTRQLVDARQRATDYAEIKKERDSLRSQLQRKVAESIARQQRDM